MKKIILTLIVLLSAIPLQVANAGSISTTLNNQSLTEGGSSLNYLLKLSAKPSGTNSVAISWNTNDQCRIAHEGRSYVKSGQVYTAGDGLVFYAKAVDDNIQEATHSCSVTYTTSSGDPNLNNLTTVQNFIIYDNGDAAATIPALYTTVLGPSSITEGSGALYSFAIGPSTAPKDALIISASTNDGQCELVSGGQVANYLEQKIPAGVQGAAIFTVRSINDSDVEGDHSCSVTHSLRTEDLDYSGITINNTYVPINDDEASFSSEAVDSEELFGRPEFGTLDSKDANNDGIEDSKQRNLGVFINAVSGRRQAVEVSSTNANCNAVSTPESKREDQQPQENDNFVFPHGLISFRVICDKPGAIAKVSYYLDELYNTENIELQKIGSSGYIKVDGLKISSFETQNGPVSLLQYQVTDGGELDEDGQVNGVIVDPVGIAISVIEPTEKLSTTTPTDQTKSYEYLVLVIPALAIAFGAGLFIRKRYLRKRYEMR